MSTSIAVSRRNDRSIWGALFGVLVLFGCTAANVPEIYHGHAGRTVLAVPSRIASSVLYDGESDWTPPEKPKAERTDRDTIRSIEFYIDLDHPDRITTDEAARERHLALLDTLEPPTIFGHVIGIGVDFPPGVPSTASRTRSNFTTGSMNPGPIFQALKPVPPEFGLETRRADWSEPVKGREMHGGSIFDVDVDYISTTEDVYIFCNDARQVVAPFTPMPTCQFSAYAP